MCTNRMEYYKWVQNSKELIYKGLNLIPKKEINGYFIHIYLQHTIINIGTFFMEMSFLLPKIIYKNRN